MEQQQAQQIKKYVDIAVRRKVLILACILLGIVAGLGTYLMEPKSYQSTTLLSYQQQKVNPAQMSPDQQAKIRDIVSTLTQIVTSRTSLERVIKNVGLYKEAQTNLPMEDVVQMMRNNIKIVPSKKGDTFKISFIGGNPKQVARVANSLAARFIEENMKYREERASETSAYTADELEMAKGMLDRKEAVMRDYKLKYYNEMPEQRANNMSRLNALQEQYQNKQVSIQDLERTQVMIQDQLAARKQIKKENEEFRIALTATTPPKEKIETEAARLNRLNSTLIELLEKYTDKHPEVRRLKKQIESLEKKLNVTKEEKKAGSLEREKTEEQFDKVLFSLNSQLKNIGLNVDRLDKEKVELLKHIEQYEKWVAAAPVREAEWSALTREYGEHKRHYDFLVAQNLQARSALNLERKQKGSQFKIEDAARVPETPVNPDFIKFLGIALFAGFGVGGALALGLELLDTSFKDPAELEKSFDVEVICTIPQMALPKEISRQRILTVVGGLVFVLCLGVIGAAFIYFWKKGLIVF